MLSKCVRVRIVCFALIFFSAVIVFSTSCLTAAPVVYDETTEGDLPEGGLVPVLPFEIGINSVTGTNGRQVPFFDDFDSFAFTVPIGAQMINGRVNVEDAENDFVLSWWELYPGSASTNVGPRMQLITGEAPGSDEILSPLGPGLYRIAAAGMEFYDPIPALANYTFTFKVVKIPEPASGGLLFVGILAAVPWRSRS